MFIAQALAPSGGGGRHSVLAPFLSKSEPKSPRHEPAPGDTLNQAVDSGVVVDGVAVPPRQGRRRDRQRRRSLGRDSDRADERAGGREELHVVTIGRDRESTLMNKEMMSSA